jgi:hypothetical protein
MDDIFVGQLMSSDLHTVTPDTFVEEAAQILLSNDIGSVIVVDSESHLEGIITTTDFVRIVAERRPKDEGAIFCLFEGSSKEAGETMHREAHGLVAGYIFTLTWRRWSFTWRLLSPSFPRSGSSSRSRPSMCMANQVMTSSSS